MIVKQALKLKNEINKLTSENKTDSYCITYGSDVQKVNKVMEKRFLNYKDGIYSANIDITILEWKDMLNDRKIFTEESLKMMEYWYSQTDYTATSREVMTQFNIRSKASPFNGIVVGLGKRIIKHLNRFEIIGTEGEKSYFIILFEGWHEDYDRNKNFVWKIRNELIQAIEDLDFFPNLTDSSNNDFKNEGVIEKHSDGSVKVSYTTTYERNKKNRRMAIELHGAKCSICGFDFEKVYGERGRGFIEVHHIKPLYESKQEIIINPAEDLICVCSNCHRMFHRKKDRVPTPYELKQEIQINKSK